MKIKWHHICDQHPKPGKDTSLLRLSGSAIASHNPCAEDAGKRESFLPFCRWGNSVTETYCSLPRSHSEACQFFHLVCLIFYPSRYEVWSKNIVNADFLKKSLKDTLPFVLITLFTLTPNILFASFCWSSSGSRSAVAASMSWSDGHCKFGQELEVTQFWIQGIKWRRTQFSVFMSLPVC